MNTKKIKNLKELKELSFKLTQSFQVPQLILLKGPLSIGKTQMVKYMTQALGCKKEDVCSPTFSIINNYTNKKENIYHVDFYRLNTLEEVDSSSFWDILQESGIIFIEWPELVEERLPHFWNKLSLSSTFAKDQTSRILQWDFFK